MKQWYVLQLMAGNEENIKNEIENAVLEKGLSEFFGEIVIPRTNILEKKTDKILSSIDMFPGYILINIEPNLEIIHVVKNIDKVIRFLGGNNPISVDEKEIEEINEKIKGKVSIAIEKEQIFELGKEIDVLSGPFAGFIGTIHSIDDDKKKITLMISIFGRLTPIDVSFDQVKI